VQYRRGVDNGAADALSRRGAPEELLAVSSPTHDWLSADALSRRGAPEELLAVSSPTHDWLSDLAQWYQSDAEAQSLLSQLVVNPSARPLFSLQQGIIKYKEHCSNKLCLHFMTVQWEVTLGFRLHSRRFLNCSTGLQCVLLFVNMCSLVLFATRPSPTALSTLEWTAQPIRLLPSQWLGSF
jgi:hypothetical protein